MLALFKARGSSTSGSPTYNMQYTNIVNMYENMYYVCMYAYIYFSFHGMVCECMSKDVVWDSVVCECTVYGGET